MTVCPDTTASSRRFRTLEGLRGVAAIAVVFLHFGGVWGFVFGHAYLAVDLFFLISGFVISHAYGARLRAGWGVKQYAIVRLKRLAPLYFLGLLVGVICYAVARSPICPGDVPFGLSLLLGIGFVPVLFGTSNLYPLNPVCWSLWDELLGNFVYAAVAPRMSRPFLCLIIATVFVILCVLVFRSPRVADIGANASNWLGGLARVGFSFPLGVLLQQLHAAQVLPRWRVLPVVLLLMAAATFVFPCRTPLYDLFVIAGIYPVLMIASLAVEPRPHGRADQIFGAAGFLSYPLYVLHFPLAWLAHISHHNGLAVPGVVAGFVIVAYGAGLYFDNPIQAWLRRRPLKGPTGTVEKPAIKTVSEIWVEGTRNF